MKIYVTAIITSPLTKEEHETTLESLDMTNEEFIKTLYPEVRKGITKGYCSKSESVWIKNIQIGW